MRKDTHGTAESAHCKRTVAEIEGAEKAFWSVVLPSKISLTLGSVVGFTCSLQFAGYFTDVICRMFLRCNFQGVSPLSEMTRWGKGKAHLDHGASARSLLQQPSPLARMAREGWENSTACFRNPWFLLQGERSKQAEEGESYFKPTQKNVRVCLQMPDSGEEGWHQL